MTFDHARRNIYGAGMKQWGSYDVRAPAEIVHHASLPMGGHPRAMDPDAKTRAIFVLAAKQPPYCVYGNPFYDHAGFVNVHSVHADGRLKENIQNAPLDDRSAVHGMVFDSREEYLYSADMWANKIWCHRKVRLPPPFSPLPSHLTDISSPSRTPPTAPSP
jgi:carboxy-cis,cis-muconate cyclase